MGNGNEKISVYTTGIGETYSRLNTINNNINIAFKNLLPRLQGLDTWQSLAGAVAQTEMHQILSNNEPRSTELQAYINVLHACIVPNYIEVESTNVNIAESLSDAFR